MIREEARGLGNKIFPPAMGHDSHRVRSVIAALKRIRDHVAQHEDNGDWDTEPYHRWISMLTGLLTADDLERMKIEESWLTSGEYLMNIDACIAFLECEGTPPRHRIDEVIDADFTEGGKTPTPGFWPTLMNKVRQ